MQTLINYINKYAQLNNEAIAEMQRLVDVDYLTKNQYLLQAGQRCNKIWFLKSGMVRKYYLHDGKEISSWIHTENEFLTSLQSYAQQIPSSEFIQACEDSEVIGLSRENSKKLSRFPQFIIFSNALMEQKFANIDQHTKAFATKTAKQKYEYLQQIAPAITQRAKLGHIASLLGITQETLSRIRHQA